MARSYFPSEDVATFQTEAAKILAGRLSMGDWVKKFEACAAAAHQTKCAIATNSCTSALEVALLASGVQPGDAVIVPVQTFIATGMAVHNIGARPLFADIRAETLCLDPAELERLAAGPQGARIRAVVPVHFAGLLSPDLPRVAEICAARGWTLIEDAAHAHGGKLQGNPAGHFGRAACLSYYPTKLITAGEAGMILTDDEELAKIARSYQFRGQDLDLPGEQFALPYGRNIRLPELSALLGVLQYGRLDEFVARRRAVAELYDRALPLAGIEVLRYPAECFHNHWLYPVVLPPGIDRAAIKTQLKASQIDVDWSYFPPLHLMPVFRQLYHTQPGELPVAEELLARLICLPIHPLINEQDAQRVVACFAQAVSDQRSAVSK